MKTRKLVSVALLSLLVLLVIGNFQNPVKADDNPPNAPAFQDRLFEAGNTNEDPFGSDKDYHFYRNGTWQTEDWIYIKVNLVDSDGVDTVFAEWKNETAWHNYTMTNIPATNYYEVNITDQATYNNYTFNIWCNDTVGNSVRYPWVFRDYELGWSGYKTEWGTKEEWRKYVGLNSTPASFAYEQLYFRNITTYASNECQYRTLPHEQPTDGMTTDTGTLLDTAPTGDEERYCASFVSSMPDGTYQMDSTAIENVYLHLWWSDDDGEVSVCYEKEREKKVEVDNDENYTTTAANSRKNITVTGFAHTDYHLEAKLWNITDQTFNDNDINLFAFKLIDWIENPSLLSTGSYNSFIIFNLPDNATLQGLDTDADGLTDYEELFTYFTDPNKLDTDGGGKSDGNEVGISRDPLDPDDDAAWTWGTWWGNWWIIPALLAALGAFLGKYRKTISPHLLLGVIILIEDGLLRVLPILLLDGWIPLWSIFVLSVVADALAHAFKRWNLLPKRLGLALMYNGVWYGLYLLGGFLIHPYVGVLFGITFHYLLDVFLTRKKFEELF